MHFLLNALIGQASPYRNGGFSSSVGMELFASISGDDGPLGKNSDQLYFASNRVQLAILLHLLRANLRNLLKICPNVGCLHPSTVGEQYCQRNRSADM